MNLACVNYMTEGIVYIFSPLNISFIRWSATDKLPFFSNEIMCGTLHLKQYTECESD